MKKLLLSVLILGLVVTTSCSKDDDGGGKSCAQLLDEITDEALDYSENPSAENCREYRDAIRAYQNKGCDNSDSFDIILDALDC